MRRRWAVAALAALAVVDVLVLALGARARGGALPPLQNEGPPLTVNTVLPTATSDATDEDVITGPLLLAANDGGDLLRATRGACDAKFDNPAKVWFGNVDTSLLEAAEVSEVHEVLGMSVSDAGTFRISGLDENCEPVTVESEDAGGSWTTLETSGLWRLPSDTTASDVQGPFDGTVPLDCVPVQMLNLPDRQGLASCASENSFYLLRAGGKKPTPFAAPGFSQLSVAPGDSETTYLVFGDTEECHAQVASLDATTTDTTDLGCLDDDKIGPRAPLAIATSGRRVVVQVGNALMMSDDGGQNFAEVG